MLLRTDPFRELDRWTQQVLGTAARPAVMPMDAWRDNDQCIVEFDLPGVEADSLSLDVERNVLTVRAERPELDQNREMVSAERARGVFSRRLFLGENVDTDKIEASYHDGVLRLTIPVAEKAMPHRIEISDDSERRPISASGPLDDIGRSHILARVAVGIRMRSTGGLVPMSPYVPRHSGLTALPWDHFTAR